MEGGWGKGVEREKATWGWEMGRQTKEETGGLGSNFKIPSLK